MHRHTPHVLAATVSPIFSYIILHFFSSIFFFLVYSCVAYANVVAVYHYYHCYYWRRLWMGKATPSNRSSRKTTSNKRKWNGLLVGPEMCEWDWFNTHFPFSYFHRSQLNPFSHIHCLSRMHSSFVHMMMCVEGVFIVIYGYVCAESVQCRQQTHNTDGHCWLCVK